MKIRIAHTSDWHIRSTQRHDEYKRVFDNFKSSIVEKKVDFVWVGGDTFHTKLTGISPEYICFLHDTLRSLGEVAEVHIMRGNHDGNMRNLERLDAVSPIVEIMNDPKVKLYKDSGVYPLNSNVNWCVYDPFDAERWNEVLPEKGKYNIACFHGAVTGAKTATGWEMEGEKSVSDFDGFDLVLLGDIHKTQFLGGKNPPRVAYPGSLVQQSYDEDLEHGYLLWTIDTDSRSHEVEFVKVEGAMPFVTINIDGSNYKDVLESGNSLKDVRCRLVCNDLTSVQKESVRDLLKHSKAHEVVVIDEEKNVKSLNTIVEGIKLDGNSSILKQAKIFFEANIKKDVEWSDVEVEIKKYISKLKIGDTKPRNWTLNSMRFSNLYSYAEDNEIVFSNLNGLVGIVGPNASGKSSILGALLYGLFNSSDRDCSKNAFYINDDKDFSKIECSVRVDGNDYIIERNTTRNQNNRDTSSTKLTFRSTKTNLTGEQRNDTDKNIKELIGSVEDFMMTSMAVQEDMGKFLKEGSTSRKEIVSRFLGIDCLLDIHALAKKDMNVVKSERKAINSSSLEFVRSEIDFKKQVLAEEMSKISDMQEKRDGLVKDINNLEIKIAKTGSSLQSRKVIEEFLSKLTNVANDLSEQIEILEKRVEDNKKTIEVLDSKIAVVDVANLAQEIKKAISIKDELTAAKGKLEISEHKHDAAKRSSLKLSEVPCGNDYPTCKFIVDSHKDKAALGTLKKVVDDINLQVKDLENKFSLLNVDSLLKKRKSYDDMKKEREEKTRDLLESEKSVGSKKDLLEKTLQKIEALNEDLSSIDEESIDRLQEMKSLLRNQQETIDNSNYNVGSFRKEIEILEKQTTECALLDKKLNTYEALIEIFSKDGLPKFVMAQHLGGINLRMNVILSKIADFTVELHLDSEKGNLEVLLKKKNRTRLAELGSGMERTLISLALRVALREISNIPMPDFFVVDEGFSMLDAENVMSCKALLHELKRMFRFVIIMTHNDVLKEMMDRTIEVSMVDGFSTIKEIT